MIEPKDIVPKEGNGYILPSPSSTSRAEESNGKSKFKRVCQYLGFEGKTFWDWLKLGIVPIILTVFGLWLNDQAQKRTEASNIEKNKQEILRSYLTTMTGLISDGKLSNNNQDSTNIAVKALTQSALTSFDKAFLSSELRDFDERVLTGKELDTLAKAELDANRKRQVLQFLYDAQLITNNSPKIDIIGIDLTGADLQKMVLGSPRKFNINLSGANLSRANLDNAKLENAQMAEIRLSEAFLKAANLKSANLKDANLEGANLEGANLEGANLNYADLTGANLTKANLTYSTREDPKTKDIKLIGANLTGAKLTNANLSHAHLNNAILTDADFRYAKGIESVDMTGATFCKTTMPEGTVRTDKCPG